MVLGELLDAEAFVHVHTVLWLDLALQRFKREARAASARRGEGVHTRIYSARAAATVHLI